MMHNHWAPTSVHFDLTKRQGVLDLGFTALVEVDKPSFHSPALESLSHGMWGITDDGTPEAKRQKEKRH